MENQTEKINKQMKIKVKNEKNLRIIGKLTLTLRMNE